MLKIISEVGKSEISHMWRLPCYNGREASGQTLPIRQASRRKNEPNAAGPILWSQQVAMKLTTTLRIEVLFIHLGLKTR